MATLNDITYEIVTFDDTKGQIIVKYSSPQYTEGLCIPIDLPIENNSVPSGQELVNLIMHFAPVSQITGYENEINYWKDRKDKLTNVDLSHIRSLVQEKIVEQPKTTGTQSL